MALYVCPNHPDDDIHSDHSYPDTIGIPLNSTLSACLIGGVSCKAIKLKCEVLDFALWDPPNLTY